MSQQLPQKINVIDSHTGGEPTRTIVKGGPNLGTGSIAERLEVFRDHFDHVRSAVVNEPRGSDVVVGALLCAPQNNANATGVIFFNNVGYLGMCGHGTIGVVATLAFMGKISVGLHTIETPVGNVIAELHESGEVSVTNIASYRYRSSVTVDVPGHGKVTGDIAYGGNWFYLVSDHGKQLDIGNVEELTEFSNVVRAALSESGYSGADGHEIDHIELFGPPTESANDSRNFVLCPGHAYDRSPCGTGTSAKLACLFADDRLQEGEVWRQESIVGSVFEGSVTIKDGKVFPRIKGTAYVTAQAELLLDPFDPFRFGIRK